MLGSAFRFSVQGLNQLLGAGGCWSVGSENDEVLELFERYLRVVCDGSGEGRGEKFRLPVRVFEVDAEG